MFIEPVDHVNDDSSFPSLECMLRVPADYLQK